MSQRTHNRRHVRIPARAGETPVTASELSKTGLRLTAHRLLTGAPVAFILVGLEEELELRGTIRWVRKTPLPYGQASFEHGISLVLPLPDRYLRLLEDLARSEESEP